MTLTIAGSEFTIPTALSEITLNDRIQFDRLYGKDLREMRKEFIEKVDEAEFADYHADIARKTVSFFGKIPMDVISETAIDDVIVIYETVMHIFSDEVNFSADHEAQQQYGWNGQRWCIYPPTLMQDSEMTFGEFIDAKQSVQNMQEKGEERWGALLPLAAIYFRKKGEAYDKEFAMDGSKRIELLKTLPLSIAIEVGFFLTCSINT